MKSKILATEFKAVASLHPAQGVADLIIIIDKSGGEARAEVKLAAHVHVNRAGRRVLRHADPQIGRRDGLGLTLEGSGAQVRDHKLIHEGRPESVCVIHCGHVGFLDKILADIPRDVAAPRKRTGVLVVIQIEVAEQGVFLALVPVETADVHVVILGVAAQRNQRASSGSRHKLQKVRRDRADTVRIDDVVGDAGGAGRIRDRFAGQGIDRIGQIARRLIRKIASAMRRRWHKGHDRNRFGPVAQALIRPEDEHLILPDWPSGGCAKLVLLYSGNAVGVEIARIQRVITKELPSRAVKFIGTGL